MSAGHSIVSGVAGRYASALFDLAKEADALDAVNDDLAGLSRLINEGGDLATLIKSPLYSRAEQTNAMQAILERAGANSLTAKFLGVVADNRRLFVLPDMIDAYAGLLAEHRGEVTAEVASAFALSEAQKSTLRGTLEERLKRKVILDLSVDSTILGGLVVRVGSRMIDSSLRTKLDNLQIAMKGVG